jgi:hypothetical protein
MVRASWFGRTIISAVSCLAFGSLCSAQQLPNTRNSLTGYDVNVVLNYVQAAWYGVYPTQGDSEYNVSDADENEAYADADAYLYDWIQANVSGYAAADPASTTYAPWVTALLRSLNFAEDTNAFTDWNASASAVAQFTVADHPFYGSVGQATNTATLRATLWFVIQGEVEGIWSWYDIMLYAEIGDSDVTLLPLDDEGQNWSADGSLSQSTSDSPSATPITVDETVLQGFTEFTATQATNVDDVIACQALVDVDSSPIYPFGHEEILYLVRASYSVLTP